MKIDPAMAEAERSRWRVVRLDTCEDVPGEILSADEQTGEVKMADLGGEERSYSLGQHGIRLLPRKR
jgi:hypothetical protein